MFWSTFLHISFQEILLFNPSLQRWMSWVWVQLADLTKVLLMLQTDNLGENSSRNTKNITHPVLLVSPVTWCSCFSLCIGILPSHPLSIYTHKCTNTTTHTLSIPFCLHHSFILLQESYLTSLWPGTNISTYLPLSPMKARCLCLWVSTQRRHEGLRGHKKQTLAHCIDFKGRWCSLDRYCNLPHQCQPYIWMKEYWGIISGDHSKIFFLIKLMVRSTTNVRIIYLYTSPSVYNAESHTLQARILDQGWENFKTK